jgi:hypothetical protein
MTHVVLFGIESDQKTENFANSLLDDSPRQRIALEDEIPKYVDRNQLSKFKPNVASLESLYESAHEAILELMLKDSFRRFLDSKPSLELKKVFRKNRVSDAVLESLQIV